MRNYNHWDIKKLVWKVSAIQYTHYLHQLIATFMKNVVSEGKNEPLPCHRWLMGTIKPLLL